MDFLLQIVSWFQTFVDIMLHLDAHLNGLIAQVGPWIYPILFLIIFCETGLVVTPFLPGDSLLFALGALSASEGSILSLPLLAALLIIAAIIGDAVNYAIGKYFGEKLFDGRFSRWLNRDHLTRTQEFYEKHGGKTIILARYMPIVRTFAPFVAGIGHMNYGRFFIYNVVGAISWVLIFLVAGFYFGNIPAIKRNFHIVIFAIIIISFLPVAVELIKARLQSKRSSPSTS